MRVRAVQVLVIVALGLCAGRAARAEGERFRFVYERAPGAEACPDEQGLRDELWRRLGREPFGADARATLSCRVAPHGDGLRAVITVIDAAGPGPERVLDSPGHDCRDLAPAMELSLALAIDPEAVIVAAVEDEPVRPARPLPDMTLLVRLEQASKRGEPVTAVQATAPTPAPAPEVTVELGAHLAADVGVGPAPGLTLAAGGGARAGVWSLGVELGVSLSSRASALDGTISTQLAAASLVPCWRRSRLALCGVLRAGVLRGEGDGFAEARSDSAVWAGGGARLTWRLAAWTGAGVQALAEVTAPLVGGRLLVGDREAWRSPPMNAALGLAVVFE